MSRHSPNGGGRSLQATSHLSRPVSLPADPPSSPVVSQFRPGVEVACSNSSPFYFVAEPRDKLKTLLGALSSVPLQTLALATLLSKESCAPECACHK